MCVYTKYMNVTRTTALLSSARVSSAQVREALLRSEVAQSSLVIAGTIVEFVSQL